MIVQRDIPFSSGIRCLDEGVIFWSGVVFIVSYFGRKLVIW